MGRRREVRGWCVGGNMWLSDNVVLVKPFNIEIFTFKMP